MKVRDDGYPVYVNPDWNEVVELAKTRPDTLRIVDNERYFAVASGYGNTHTTVVSHARAYVRHGIDSILYKEGREWFLNMIDVDIEDMDNERLTISELRDGLVGKPLYEFLTDFIQAYANESKASKLLGMLERYVAPKVNTNKINQILDPTILLRSLEREMRKVLDSFILRVISKIRDKIGSDTYVSARVLSQLNKQFKPLKIKLTSTHGFYFYGIAGAFIDPRSSDKGITVQVNTDEFLLRLVDPLTKSKALEYFIGIIIHEAIHLEQYKGAKQAGRKFSFMANLQKGREADPVERDFKYRKLQEFPAHAAEVALRLQSDIRPEMIDTFLTDDKAFRMFLFKKFTGVPFIMKFLDIDETSRDFMYFFALVKRYVEKGTHVTG